MTTLEQSNKLVAQPRNPFRWLRRWLTWSHTQEKVEGTHLKKELDPEILQACQQAITEHVIERSTRYL